MCKILLLVIIIVLILYNKYFYYEHLTSTPTEAIQNLSSMYNSGSLNTNNLVIQENASISGNLNVNGEITAKSINLTKQPTCQIRGIHDAFYNGQYLDRFPAICNSGEYMQGFYLHPFGGDTNNWEMRYVCCKLNDVPFTDTDGEMTKFDVSINNVNQFDNATSIKKYIVRNNIDPTNSGVHNSFNQ